MNLFAAFADSGNQTLPVVIGIGLFLLVLFTFLLIWANRYVKVGPDQALVISGRRCVIVDSTGKQHVSGFRIVKGGGTFVWPVYEQVQVLSLKPLSFDLTLPNVPTRDAARLEITAKAQIRILPDDLSQARAAECLLGKSQLEIQETSSQLLESAVRSLVGQRSAEELARNQSTLANQWLEAAKPALADIGLTVLTLLVRDVRFSESGMRSRQ